MDHEPETQDMEQEAAAQSPGTERRSRVRRLRCKVVAGAVACLAAIGGAITVRMASGEDPVLGSGESSDGASRTVPSPDRQPEEGDRPLPGEGSEDFPFRDGAPASGQPGELHSGQS